MKKITGFMLALAAVAAFGCAAAQAADKKQPAGRLPVMLIKSSQASGALGTKTNPIKINKPTTKIYGGYIPSNSPDNGRGSQHIRAGTKVYFEADPLETTGISVHAFGFRAKMYNQSCPVCKLTQDKKTGAYSPEKCDFKGMDIIYDKNFPDPNYRGSYTINDYKFLYALDYAAVEHYERGPGDSSVLVQYFYPDIWIEIPEAGQQQNPPQTDPTPPAPGGSASKCHYWYSPKPLGNCCTFCDATCHDPCGNVCAGGDCP